MNAPAGMAGNRRIDGIVIHCAATRPGMDIGAAEIRRWHRDRGWTDIGYHNVIRRDGTVEDGRPHHVAGAHVAGHNSHTLGVCMVGGIDDDGAPENNFTSDQFAALAKLLLRLQASYPDAWIKGHRDLFAGKACPSFDVARWLDAGRPYAWTGKA